MALQAENAMLRQELFKAHEELANLESQMEHIMDMVKRALLGDGSAGEYLANITGISAIQSSPEPQNQMSQMQRHVDVPLKLKERVDFLNNALDEHFEQFESNSKQRRSSTANISNNNSNLRRTNSASSVESRRKPKDLCVGDLILQKEKMQASSHQVVNFTPAHPSPIESLRNKKTYEPIKHPFIRMAEQSGQLPNSHLFNADDVVTKKRPSITSAELKLADEIRSKPRNTSIKSSNDKGIHQEKPCANDFMNGRQMKFEVVSPQSCFNAAAAKPPSGRIVSAPHIVFGRTTRVPVLGPIPRANSKASENYAGHENPSSGRNHQTCNKSQADRLYPSRPACIDEFSKDMDSLHNLEAQFEKTALNLQKKLGISSEGIVLP